MVNLVVPLKHRIEGVLQLTCDMSAFKWLSKLNLPWDEGASCSADLFV